MLLLESSFGLFLGAGQSVIGLELEEVVLALVN